jgi:hypothetical protein
MPEGATFQAKRCITFNYRNKRGEHWLYSYLSTAQIKANGDCNIENNSGEFIEFRVRVKGAGLFPIYALATSMFENDAVARKNDAEVSWTGNGKIQRSEKRFHEYF